jgi:branched-subunit amino acid transport protein
VTESDSWLLYVAVIGMALVTVLTRSFFFLSSRPWTLPPVLHTALRYAPVAALAAVIAPEVVMSQGQLIDTWKDARPYSLAAGIGWFYLRRGVLGTIVAGMAVYLPLRIGLGW